MAFNQLPGSWSAGRSTTWPRHTAKGLLNVGQGLMAWTNEKPACRTPWTIRSARCFGLPEKPRAAKLTPEASTQAMGLIGASEEPDGVLLVLKPSGEVGDV